MLRINELRIGSWILENGQPVKVSAIEYGGERYCRINETVTTKKDITDIFTPIMITPELLATVGFTTTNDIDKLSLNISGNTDLAYSEQKKAFQYNEQWFPQSPAFVHQLQNIYLVLCGKELEVDLS